MLIGTAFYNCTVPTQMADWTDRMAVAGRTFGYIENGLEGVVGGRGSIRTVAPGGVFGTGNPDAAVERAGCYLTNVFAYIGSTAPDVIVGEGPSVHPDQRERAVGTAPAHVAQLA